MLNPKVSAVLLRIVPPSDHSEGYCQSGIVSLVTDTTIVLWVQVDVIRSMSFQRKTGLDTAGLGSFIVHPDSLS